MTSEQPTAEALKQRRKREKKQRQDEALGVELVSVEVAGGFKAGISRLKKKHGFNNAQEMYQNLLRNVLAADDEVAAWMLRGVTTPFTISVKVSRKFEAATLAELQRDPGDEVISPE
jgi:hypothetical protein